MANHYGLQLHALFMLVFLALHASSCEQEEYWKMKLPKVPMPQAIKDSLLHVHENTKDQNFESKTSVDQPFTVTLWKYDDLNKAEGQKLVKNARIDQPFTVGAWKYDSNNDKDQKFESKTSVDQPFTVTLWKYDDPNKAEVQKLVKNARIDQPFTVGAWKYDSNNHKDQKFESKTNVDQPFTVGAWKYDKENSKEEGSKEHHHHNHAMHNDINLDDAQEDLRGGSVFFVEKSLRLGMKLKHDFQKTPNVPFLPQHIAQTIPFSDAKFAEILNLFSIKVDSPEATAVKGTLDVCLHRPKVKKENKTCAQSMEDVVDFVVGELGTNDVELRMMRNDIEVIHGIKDYVITKVKKLVVPRNTAVACHKMIYPYVVYYCHHQEDIGHYDVTLVSPASGAAIQTTAVCHYDTYAWQPDVPALRYLGIRPGDAPVCHFSAINDMFWAIKDNSKSSLDMAQ